MYLNKRVVVLKIMGSRTTERLLKYKAVYEKCLKLIQKYEKEK